MIPKVTVFFDWGFQCYQLSLVEQFALSKSRFYSKLKAMQFAPQLVPLVLLSPCRLTAVLTQFQQFQSCQHTVCCSWCWQADCCHRLLTLILLCIYTILRHIMNSKYTLADCSLLLSFFSNCDRSCVYSSSTVGAAAHCFTDVILQDTDLAMLFVPLDTKNSLTGFLTH